MLAKTEGEMKISLIYATLTCLLYVSLLGCSDGIEVKNKKLFLLVNTSFVNDTKAKRKYRYEVRVGSFTEKSRINVVCKCAELHLEELKRILKTYQPEMRYRGGPYGTSRIEFSADSSLLLELKGLIKAYEDLLLFVKERQNVALENVHEYVSMVNLHKRNFYERARMLHLIK